VRWGRIFRVDKNKVPDDEIPDILRGVQASRLFVEDSADREVEFYYKLDVKKYYAAVHELAFAIARRLEALNVETALDGGMVDMPTSNGRTVFVAVPATDTREPYRALVEELLRSGYSVVPDPSKSPPDTGDEAEGIVVNGLADAELSIHLLGERSGIRPDGLDSDLVPFQLARAAAEADRRPSFHRLIWAPKALPTLSDEIAETSPRDPLDVLARFDQSLPSDIVHGDTWKDFQEFLFYRLESKDRRDHLPEKLHVQMEPRGEAQEADNLPGPLQNVDAPFAYGWTSSLRVAAIAGAQNLPFYPHFSSEEEHRRALEACRVGAERLLKALRRGRYNARPEYAEALEYYLDDLPQTAGAGNILNANDQVRILHAMFLADAAMLPEGLASRLKSVIANQFALNAFYDLVQRHNDAVSAGNWTRPFPIEAAKGFFGAVENNTPRWFEPQVEQGLRLVEQAEPPAAAPIEQEPAPASVIQPPPLPPGTPDAQASWRRQMATAANALWETFLQGRDMPVAQDEWRAAAEELGGHVRPIIDFLGAQEGQKP